MPQFNATDAIFFGFRIVKRDPTLLIALVVLLAIVGIGGALLTARELAEFTSSLEAFSTMDPEADPSLLFSEMGSVYGAYFGSPKVLLVMLVGILASIAVQGAVLRSLVLDRRDGWVMGLQIGGDELRIFVVSLIVGLLVGLLYLGLIVAVGIVVGILSVVRQALGVLVLLVGMIAVCVALGLAGTRLSAAAPASVGEKKFIVFGSWQITKGRMWGLFGAYVILFFIFAVAYMFVFVLMSLAAPEAAGLAQGMTTVTDPEEAVAAFTSPGYILVLVLNAALSVMVIAAWSGVGAYAYRMLGAGAGYPNAQPPHDNPPNPIVA